MTGTWTKEDTDTLKELWEGGVSTTVIAQVLGRSRSAVAGMIHRKGFKCDVPKRTNPQVAERRKARAAGPQPLRWGKPVSMVPTAPIAPKVVICDDARNISLFDLREHHCRWPSGEQAPFVFCGKKKVPSSPYCGFHSRVAFAGFVKAPRRGEQRGTR